MLLKNNYSFSSEREIKKGSDCGEKLKYTTKIEFCKKSVSFLI